MADRTIANIILDVRSLLNEPSALGVSDTEITSFVDAGAMEVAIKSNLLRTSTTLFTLAGSDTYGSSSGEYHITAAGGGGDILLLDSIHKIYHVVYIGALTTTDDGLDAGYATSKALIKIHPRQLDHVSSNTLGIPNYWYWTASSLTTGILGVWPKPSAAQNGHFVKIFYSGVADAYDSSGTEYLPEWAQDLCVWYAYARCLERDGKFAQANQYMSYFNNLVMFHRSDIVQEEIDSKDMMTIPDYTRVAQQ